MSAWQITGCTVADAAALGRNNISAFWEDPTWVLLWPKHITRDFLIEQAGKRYARNLLSDRAATRHQKAVDPNTGALVGYARWILPESHTVDETGQQPAWPDAQVPPVSSAEEEQFRLLAESAWWQFDSGMSGIDDKNHAVMDRICAERPYISEFCKNDTSHVFAVRLESRLC
jgi:hypothetical protein